MFFGVLMCASSGVSADIHQQNAFLYGNNIEVGIGPDGAFGSDVTSPDSGRKSKGKRVGFITDPTDNRFQGAYHGDFFLPGYPEEGWGVGFDGKAYNNNSNQQGAEIIGTLKNYNGSANNQNVTWEGEIEGLEITQIYRVHTLSTAVVFDITLKNTTATTMNNVYYMRTVDPDNNAEQDPSNSAAKYITKNTILAQGSDGNGYSAVSATQGAKSGNTFSFTESQLTLNAYGENSRVTYGGVYNRNPADVYNGTGLLKQTGTNTSDEAISLAFKFDQIEPGDSVTFRAGYQLKDLPIANLDIDKDDSSGVAGNEFKQLYILGNTASKVTDTDIEISGNGFTNLQEAIITITNPHDGDILDVLGSLPGGISIDTAESSDTKLFLKGTASKVEYQNALTQVRFANSDTHSSVDTRKITVQVRDDNATLSNSATSTVEITVPVVLSTPKIAGDDIVNASEVANVKLAGHAAPNATITIDFTDKDGKKLSPAKTVTADDNGNWSIDGDPADLTDLSDGPITVLVVATDPNGKISSLTQEIIKDTAIILIDITPIDNQLLSSMTPNYQGKTDPNASVELKVLSSGKVYNTTANASGDWDILLDSFAMGITQSVKITAEDDYANVASETQSFRTPALPIEVTDLDVDAKGIANSTTPTLKGTSDPSTSISIDMPTGNGQSIECATTTDTDGNWSCKMPVSPTGGPYTVTATTTDGNANTNSVSKQISIPKLPLIIDNPANNAVISGVKPIISGTSKPGTDITVVVSATEQCTAVTDDTNHWSCELPSLAFDNNYTLTVTTEDSIGNKTTEAVDVSTDKLPLAIISPKDNSMAEDTTPTFIGTTAPNATVTVTAASGQECTTKADSEGRWSCELPALPVGGPYDITIKAVDAEGNNTSIDQSISIPEISLIIISPTDGQKITGTSVTVTGSSDPNTPIKVLGPDGESCETTSDDNGAWSCELDKLQSGTAKNITVISGEGGAGNKGNKVAITSVDIENSSEGVKTILAGSSSLFMLFLLSLILLLNHFRKEILGMSARKS